ncbi:uncharacterized protein [Porites lutea]|uniref:uncharacterized protein n=1 Tax=Porites lutea TaxID=51062 RepID=UPI003CC5147A
MENTNKRTLTLLSSFQIVISVCFLVLGVVDGLEIRYRYVSLVFSPCWIVPLTLANGILGLLLSESRKRSSNLIHAIWSVSVACIIYSAITVLRYQDWGVESLTILAISQNSRYDRDDKWWFQATAMEKSKKITLAFLSLFQIVISGLLFVLGMVDGLEIRFVYVSLVFSPCWIVPLVLSNGIMGLVLIIIHKRSSLLIHAIWSVSVACIIYSAITVFRYQTWGVQLLLSNKISYSDHSGKYFVKKDFKMKYTKQENDALAVFGIIIVLSVIEIILAAALAKVSDSSHKGAQQPTIPMYAMHYQVR